MGTMEQGRHDALVRLHEVTTRANAGADLATVVQTIADGIVEVSGFRATTVNLLRPDGEFELVAIGGDEPGLDDLLHTRYSSESVLARNADAERWGRFRFIPHTAGKAIPEGFRALDFDPIDHADAWHPLDELSVELTSPGGDLIGIMYVDHPGDGLRPDADLIELMEIFAGQAGVAIAHAQQREQLRESAWLGGMLRRVIDTVGTPRELDATMDSVLEILRSELSADAAWLDVFPSDDPGSLVRSRGDDGVFTVSAAIGAYGATLARDAQDRDRSLVLGRRELGSDHRLLTEGQRSWMQRALDADGVHAIALAPLDLDEDVAGQIVVMRKRERSWTTLEAEAVRDVGRELGWAIGRDRSRHRERMAREDLERVARERRELLQSLASEVGPLFASVDNYLTAQRLEYDHPARLGLDRFWTLFERVGALVAFEQPGGMPMPEKVDVPGLLGVQWSYLERVATEHEVQLLALDAQPAQYAWADPAQLEWVTQLLLEDVLGSARRQSSVRISVVTLNGRLVMSAQTSGLDDAPEHSRRVGDRVADSDARWWRTGVSELLARQDGRLTTRTGPLGRRVLSVSLPVPPEA
ncbi:GAF domain-containing protein [Nocardioides mangrovicus]|uniref:GAF domain-containing protein n=1 Tax=Nocardioides mangrovicus TaxID=2478913 RepID=A0A3L8NXR3_9ACTN|nr:GAF domain-containing protein [Nocardioides mangrovicus]RLV47940.1 GAF domain-containing protein [Nocardioides mangrovicus]